MSNETSPLPRQIVGRSIAESVGLAAAVIVGFGALYAVIARVALDAFPYSGDEYSLSLQAELFARGLLKAPAPAHPDWWRVDHVIIDQWVRSKYPPGAALLLAIGVRAGVTWLVTPVEGAVALTLVWLTTRRLLGPTPALVALVTLGLAPLFAFQAASFYSHTATTMFLAGGFAAIAAWSRTRRAGWLLLVGAASGLAFLTRPLDALLFGLALVSLRSLPALVIPAAGAAPFVAGSLLYQYAQFGSPFTDGYRAYRPTFAALYGPTAGVPELSPCYLWNPVQIWNHLDVYRAFIVDWTFPGSVVIALVGLFTIGPRHSARPLRTLSMAWIVVCAAALLPTLASPDDGARPRYLSTVLIPIAFLAASGFAPACAALAARFGARVTSALVVVTLVVAPVQLAQFLVSRVPQVWSREGLFRSIERAGLRDAIVVVRAKYPSRYARNGGRFDGNVLYLSPPAETSGGTIANAFPDRAAWEAREGDPWTLSRIR